MGLISRVSSRTYRRPAQIMNHLSSIILSLLLHFFPSHALIVRGSLPLDSVTFDKIISKFDYTFVKFDTAYPYGDKHDEYKKVAIRAKENPNFICAEVNINEYGDQENQDMGTRFGIDKEKYPHYRLFKQNGEHAIMPNHDVNWKEDDILMFLRESGVWIGMEDCTERMDQYAAIFMDELIAKNNRDHAEQVMDSVEEFYEAGGSADTDAKVAKVYFFVMEKILAKGNEWYKNEAWRIKTILGDENKVKSITKDKLDGMKMRLNVLYSFAQPMRIRQDLRVSADEMGKDEL